MLGNDIARPFASEAPFRNTAQLNQLNRFELSYKEKCDQVTGVSFVDDWCHLTEGGNNPDVLVVGDSQSNAFATVLSSLRQSHNFGFTQIGRGGCPSLLNYGKPACRELASAAFVYALEKPAIQHVVLISNWPIYMKDNLYDGGKATKDDFETALVQTISAFEKAGKKISIVLAIPVDPEPRACVKRTIRITSKDICNLPKTKALAADGNYREFFGKLNQQFPKISFFDPWKYICDEEKCKVMDGDNILYVDSSHLSINGGAYLANSASTELMTFFNVNEHSKK